MSNEIEKFDPSKLMEGVRDRVKATFVSLIPDAQWEQMVKTESDRFFAPFVERPYYEKTKDKYSDFQLLCMDVMAGIAKEKIKTFLETYSSSVWSNNEMVASEILMEALKKNAAEIFAGMIGSRVSTIINEMKSRNY